MTPQRSECIVTHMRELSTSETRRGEARAAALQVFASRGYAATTVAQVAEAAGISSAYAFKLFGSKEEMFVRALELCFERIVRTLRAAAGDAGSASPLEVLDRMALGYARLITDRDLLLLQVHAQSEAANPRIRDALQQGLRAVVECATELSGAGDEDVQRFMAYGQLCHLVVTAGIDVSHGAWARTLTHGIRHPDTA